MSAKSLYVVKIIDLCMISPPPNSVSTTTLPLTFFDVPWLLCHPMQRIFFYQCSHSTHHFTTTIFPSLKHSLSLTLQHFFPLAANLIIPPPPHRPHILYTADEGSVLVTLAESTSWPGELTGFNDLIANYPRAAVDLHSFVPDLPSPRVSSHGSCVVPIMAVQVTVFPNEGISVGVTFMHVADGLAFHHFMKSWALIFRTRDGSDLLEKSTLPVHDRSLVKDPNGIEHVLWNDWWSWGSAWCHTILDHIKPNHDQLSDKVRATFLISPAQIVRLKKWVAAQINEVSGPEVHSSTFVVTCSLIWVCLIKSQEGKSESSDDEENYNYFAFVADCRNRLEYPLPSNYFGNCLGICVLRLKGRELMGRNGIVLASEAIGKRVKELDGGAGAKGAEKWMISWKEASETGRLISVAGSPKLGAYETDFGWGKPKKSEVVHVDVGGSFSLSDCGNEKGGIEVGVGLSKGHMNSFIRIWDESLKMLFN